MLRSWRRPNTIDYLPGPSGRQAKPLRFGQGRPEIDRRSNQVTRPIQLDPSPWLGASSFSTKARLG